MNELSERCDWSGLVHVGLVVNVEVLVLLERWVQSEQYVQGLHHRVVGSLVHRNVDNVAGDFRVLCQRQIDLFRRERQLRKHLLHFLRPHLHQRVDIWHSLCVWHRRWLLVLVHVSHWSYPWQNLFRIFLCLLNWMNFRVFSSDVLLAVVHHHQLDFSFVWLIQARLIKDVES